MQLKARLITGSLLALVIALVVSAFPQAQTVAKFGHTRPQAASGPSGSPGGLIQATNLHFAGMVLRVASGTFAPDNDHWDYGGYGLEFAPNDCTNGGLYMGTGGSRVAELCVPAVANWSTSSSVSAIPLVSSLASGQGMILPQDSYSNDAPMVGVAGDANYRRGDCKLWNGYLYCTQQLTYDGANNQAYAWFRRSPTLSYSPSTFSGWVRILSNWCVGISGCSVAHDNSGNTWTSQHVVSGMMATVPAPYNTTLGKMLIGNIGANVISTTSIGPALLAVDPDQFSYGSTQTATDLAYYHDESVGGTTYATLGYWNPRLITLPEPACASGNANCGDGPSNKPYHVTGTTTIGGVVVPTGWRSVLVFGRGASHFCYGYGTTNTAQDAVTPAYGDYAVSFCLDTYDDSTSSPGVHSSERDWHVWAYDINDLLHVKNGDFNSAKGRTWKPWDVVPYADWMITLPVSAGNCQGSPNGTYDIGGIARGSISGQEYIFGAFQEADTTDFYACKPLVAAFTVS